MKIYWSIIFLVLACLPLAGCRQYYLSLCQEWVDVRYLASSHVGTPDPRQEHPPIGQKIIIDWRVPSEILKKKPKVILHLILWDHTTRTIQIPITKRMDYATYRLFNDDYEKSGGILTYKAEIITEDGHIYREWKHQLWVNLIKIDQDVPANTEESASFAE